MIKNVLHGSSFAESKEWCRTPCRLVMKKTYKNNDLGFRILFRNVEMGTMIIGIHGGSWRSPSNSSCVSCRPKLLPEISYHHLGYHHLGFHHLGFRFVFCLKGL